MNITDFIAQQQEQQCPHTVTVFLMLLKLLFTSHTLFRVCHMHFLSVCIIITELYIYVCVKSTFMRLDRRLISGLMQGLQFTL